MVDFDICVLASLKHEMVHIDFYALISFKNEMVELMIPAEALLKSTFVCNVVFGGVATPAFHVSFPYNDTAFDAMHLAVTACTEKFVKEFAFTA